MSLQGNMARTAIEGLETKTAEMEALAARLEAEVARLRAQRPDAELLERAREALLSWETYVLDVEKLETGEQKNPQ